MALHTRFFLLTLLSALFLIAAQCSAPMPAATPPTENRTDGTTATLTVVPLAKGQKLKVLATTSIVADIVRNVGGEAISLSTLLPTGTDPHSFEPTPTDLAVVAGTHVIFANGMGLEEFLTEMIKNAGGTASVVEVSHGIEPRQFIHEKEAEHKEADHNHEGADPHTWTSPANVKVFVRNIELVLSALDPANAKTYRANAKTYTDRLDELDAWVKTQIETVPVENRELITDHAAFGYYADRYGLTLVGAVIPSFTTVAEPSAQELAQLQDAIRQYDVKAVFVGVAINPALSERIANDTGVKLITLYDGSLGDAGSGAETYLDYIRYNTGAIVSALK